MSAKASEPVATAIESPRSQKEKDSIQVVEFVLGNKKRKNIKL